MVTVELYGLPRLRAGAERCELPAGPLHALLGALAGALGTAQFALLLGGGLLYTLGAGVYAARRPDPWPATFGYHEVFHSFTIAAFLVQYAAIAMVVA